MTAEQVGNLKLGSRVVYSDLTLKGSLKLLSSCESHYEVVAITSYGDLTLKAFTAPFPLLVLVAAVSLLDKRYALFEG